MPLTPLIDHFAEAIAVWCGCILLFVLVVALRRAWIQHAKATNAAVRASRNAGLDPGSERRPEEGPVE